MADLGLRSHSAPNPAAPTTLEYERAISMAREALVARPSSLHDAFTDWGHEGPEDRMDESLDVPFPPHHPPRSLLSSVGHSRPTLSPWDPPIPSRDGTAISYGSYAPPPLPYPLGPVWATGQHAMPTSRSHTMIPGLANARSQPQFQPHHTHMLPPPNPNPPRAAPEAQTQPSNPRSRSCCDHHTSLALTNAQLAVDAAQRDHDHNVTLEQSLAADLERIVWMAAQLKQHVLNASAALLVSKKELERQLDTLQQLGGPLQSIPQRQPQPTPTSSSLPSIMGSASAQALPWFASSMAVPPNIY